MKNIINVKESGRNYIAHRRENDGTSQSLDSHLLNVSRLTKEFTKEIQLQKSGELIGILHDLGKASYDFYTYICSATGLLSPDEDEYVNFNELKGKIDHSSAGAQHLFRIMSSLGHESMALAQVLVLPLFSHHSGLIDCINSQGVDNFSRKINKPEELTHTKEAWETINHNLKARIALLTEKKAIDEILGELKEKLRYAVEEVDTSNERYFKYGLLVRMLFSCLIDADRLDTADFEYPEIGIMRNNGIYVQWEVLSRRLEEYIEEFNPRNEIDLLRNEVSRECLIAAQKEKGLYQLRVPTGGGKTLSSLRFAINHALEHNESDIGKFMRIIYVIPYTSIIEQNADVARTALESDLGGKRKNMSGVVLEHHSNLSPDKETMRQHLLSENWDAQIVFTTMVQFLEAVFGRGTKNARRMHQLANSIIIFDEIQTLPVRCVHMFNVSTRFLVRSCGATVVLCTATQPLLNEVKPQERAIAPGEIVDLLSAPLMGKLALMTKRYEVFDCTVSKGFNNNEISEMVKSELIVTGSVLVVVNKKNSAKQLFETIGVISTINLYHLSTSMCPKHRRSVLEMVKSHLSKNEPVVCISTNLIEAGVDIDFGTVIRYIAGLDSITQSAGRCNRSGIRNVIGRVLIVNPRDESLKQLRDIEAGKLVTERILYEYRNDPTKYPEGLLGKEALRQYYLSYFYNRETEMSYPISGDSSVGRRDNLYELLSKNQFSCNAYKRINGINKTPIMLKQSFKSAADEFEAIDSYTQGIIVPYEDEGSELIKDLCELAKSPHIFKYLKQAQQFSVNVFSHEFERLLTAEAIHETYEGSGIYYLKKACYSMKFGWTMDSVAPMDLCCV